MAKNKNATVASAAVATEKRVHNDAETFIAAWHKHAGVANLVAAELGLKPASVTVRASQYRKMGIKLPRAARQGGGAKLNVEALNATIEKLYTTVPEETTAAE